MSYFKGKKKKAGKKFLSWFIIIILFFLSLFLIKSVYGVFSEERKSNLNKKESVYIYDELKEKELQILSEIEYLKTEKGVETELRDKFRVVKKGEQMAVIINSKDDDKGFFKKEKETIFEKVKNLFNFLRN